MLYTIWIVPPEPLYSQLKNIIRELSIRYDSPLFEPHMTLLGNIDSELPHIKSKLALLASRIDQFTLKLDSVSFSTTYFQSVFVRVHSTAQLLQLNLEAKKMFGMENDVFMPHISLLYGEHEMRIREKAVSEVQISSASFVVDSFVLTPATIDPNTWEHVAVIPFKKD